MGEDINNLNQANMGVDISKPPPANIGEDKSIIDKPSIENKTHEQLALFSDDNTPGMTPFISEQAMLVTIKS